MAGVKHFLKGYSVTGRELEWTIKMPSYNSCLAVAKALSKSGMKHLSNIDIYTSEPLKLVNIILVNPLPRKTQKRKKKETLDLLKNL